MWFTLWYIFLARRGRLSFTYELLWDWVCTFSLFSLDIICTCHRLFSLARIWSAPPPGHDSTTGAVPHESPLWSPPPVHHRVAPSRRPPWPLPLSTSAFTSLTSNTRYPQSNWTYTRAIVKDGEALPHQFPVGRPGLAAVGHPVP